ncbi:hypothetical protein D3C86_1030690 [compost metagenome]
MQLGWRLRGGQLEMRQALGLPPRTHLGRRLAIAGLGMLQRLASLARLCALGLDPELLAQLIEPGFLRRRLEFHGGSDGHRGFGLHLLDAGRERRQRGLRPLGLVTRQRLLRRGQHGIRAGWGGLGSGATGRRLGSGGRGRAWLGLPGVTCRARLVALATGSAWFWRGLSPTLGLHPDHAGVEGPGCGRKGRADLFVMGNWLGRLRARHRPLARRRRGGLTGHHLGQQGRPRLAGQGFSRNRICRLTGLGRRWLVFGSDLLALLLLRGLALARDGHLASGEPVLFIFKGERLCALPIGDHRRGWCRSRRHRPRSL